MFWSALYMVSFKGGGTSNGRQLLFYLYFFICEDLMSYPLHWFPGEVNATGLGYVGHLFNANMSVDQTENSAVTAGEAGRKTKQVWKEVWNQLKN